MVEGDQIKTVGDSEAWVTFGHETVRADSLVGSDGVESYVVRIPPTFRGGTVSWMVSIGPAKFKRPPAPLASVRGRSKNQNRRRDHRGQMIPKP